MNDRPEPKTLASLAHAAFDNPAFVQAVADTRDRIVDDWASSDPADADLRERCFFKYHALEDIVNFMGNYMAEGAAEETEAPSET